MTTIPLDVLATVCAEPGHYRPWLSRPFSLRIADRVWTVATNGARLLAVRHDYGAADPDQSVGEGIIGFHAVAFGPDGAPFDVAAVRDFFAAHAPALEGTCPECNGNGGEDCPECDGEGETECECFDCGNEHTVECKACNGTGGWTCKRCAERDKPVPVCLDGTVFDARIMAPLFAAIPSDTATLHAGKKARMWALAGTDWFAVFMPMRCDDLHGLPRLSLMVPA